MTAKMLTDDHIEPEITVSRIYGKWNGKMNIHITDDISMDYLWINDKYDLNFTTSFEGENNSIPLLMAIWWVVATILS